MSSLYERLIEVCRDQKIDSPIGVDIQKLTGLSSGRVTQIKGGGNAARLGDDALRKLMRLGYMPDWVQEGKLPKFRPVEIVEAEFHASKKVSPMRKKQDPHIAEVIRLMEATDSTGRVLALGGVKAALDKYVPAAKKGRAK